MTLGSLCNASIAAEIALDSGVLRGVKSRATERPAIADLAEESMHQVLVDLYPLRNIHCGLGQFSLHLAQHLVATPSHVVSPRFLVPSNIASLPHCEPWRLWRVPAWRRERFTGLLRPWLAPCWNRERHITLWHGTYQTGKHLPWRDDTPFILTIHDLNFLRERPADQHPRLLARLQDRVDRACMVTTISQFVADEIRERLNLRGKPLHVVYNGVIVDRHDNPQRPEFLPQGEFLFTLGTVLPKKHFHVLIDFMRELPQYRLVIAGDDRDEYAAVMRRQIQSAGLVDRVFLPGPVSDRQRQWLYAHCTAFLFPSLTEGFGMPPIEAMAHGRPVFLSRLTSLPEVAGEAGFYWDDFSAPAMLRVFHQGLAEFRNNAGFPQRLQAQAARFSWERTARQYMRLYEEVASGLPTATAPRAHAA